jgi:MoaA/NifB/PqqE/SkfB family radical SAM enzyme
MLAGGSPVTFNRGEHHFQSGLQVDEVLQRLALPMTVTLQITRRCNLRCIYCSEDAMIKEPTHAFLASMIDKLQGVSRVIIAGGEPTLRKDLADIADELARKVSVVAMASNVVLMTPELAARLSRSLSYVDVTVDGKRETHDKIRGSYDQVLRGIHLLIDAGVEVSLVTVLLTDNEADVLDVCRLADELKAKKLKILTPIRKGRGANIVSHGLETKELSEVFERVKEAKSKNGWRTRVTLTDWEYVNEGHAILVHPNGDVVASPVPSEPGCVKLLGNLQNQELVEIWKSYPFRQNHVNKYLEETLYVC